MVLEVEIIIEQLNPTAMLLWIKVNGPWGLVQLLVWVGVTGGEVFVMINGVGGGM